MSLYTRFLVAREPDYQAELKNLALSSPFDKLTRAYMDRSADMELLKRVVEDAEEYQLGYLECVLVELRVTIEEGARREDDLRAFLDPVELDIYAPLFSTSKELLAVFYNLSSLVTKRIEDSRSASRNP
jgi:hypothetical protein